MPGIADYLALFSIFATIFSLAITIIVVAIVAIIKKKEKAVKSYFFLSIKTFIISFLAQFLIALLWFVII